MTQKHTCYAGPILLRSLFELSLQFEYLLQDREVRSNQYAEFAHIKKHEIMQAIVHNPGGFISQQLACSPLREEGEARNKAEYDRVRPRFLNKKGGTWSKWYGNSAFWLAEILEREAEYRLIYAQTSAWSHGDPCLIMAAQIDAFGRPEIFWMILVGYYSRILCALAESFKIVLSHEQFEVLKNLAKDKS